MTVTNNLRVAWTKFLTKRQFTRVTMPRRSSLSTDVCRDRVSMPLNVSVCFIRSYFSAVQNSKWTAPTRRYT